MIFLETPANESVIDMMMKGGWLMIPLLLLSIITVFIFFDRYFFIKAHDKTDNHFFNNLKELIKEGKTDTAMALCNSADTSESRILAKGIANLGKPVNEIYHQMEMEGKLEVYKYESNLYFLGVIAGIAPMFGFIGTISGVIKIFYNISKADNISISLISGGLYEKLITSGVGLFIGIIAYIFYHFLNNKIDKMIQRWEYRSVRFIDLINS
ncbi:MAG: MotA/TolQ/ExbB proton channel family protein [Methylococcaceae bacterium]|nr:MotA/TolQ/ExbB proton channel family protein [Prolixibacteraceae bacterium]